jgi:uncharacterized protein YbjT (DUF2867 family)
MVSDKIVITGGNGFVGRQIAQQAVRQGLKIISIARTGKPSTHSASSLLAVDWVQADVFDVAEWQHHLIGSGAVIHCIGIIEENPELGQTFERMIFESARVVALAAKKAGVRRFVYLSAGAGAPETPPAYMENKLKAENFLRSLGLSLTILRPGLIYGSDKPETVQENEQIQYLLTDPHIGPHIWPNRPLPVESVAKVALLACSHDFGEILAVDAIEQIASQNL